MEQVYPKKSHLKPITSKSSHNFIIKTKLSTPKASSNIVCNQKSTTDGLNVAEPESVPADETTKISLVREYEPPEFRRKPDRADIERANRVELQFLKERIAAQNDKLRRQREIIESEIKMLMAALDGTQETLGEIKRRISRLKGALEYRGRSDYNLTER